MKSLCRTNHTPYILLIILLAFLRITSSQNNGKTFKGLEEHGWKSGKDLPPGLLANRRARGQKCRENRTLEEREANADVVFSGTVRQVFGLKPGEFDPSTGHQVDTAVVEVKRIFKGVKLVAEELAMTYRTGGRPLLQIEGFSDPHICRSRTRRHDTRIFLVNRDNTGQLKLNSSLVRMSLQNIEKAEAAINDTEYKPRPTTPIPPCLTKFCPFHGECVVAAGVAECRCPQHQCTDGFTPVCGSDNVSYSSLCHLKEASCTDQRRIEPVSNGSCSDTPGDRTFQPTNEPDTPTDPCLTKQCLYGSRCIPDEDGPGATCHCPHACLEYGINLEPGEVCGSDGKEYKNECELKQTACRELRPIQKRYVGKCDPCRNHICSVSQLCKLDSARQPICSCGEETCPPLVPDSSPVCASDGKNYPSECEVRQQACLSGKNIKVVYYGHCPSDGCDRKKCGLYEYCEVGWGGQAKCVCPVACEELVRPVCGSDGLSYDSECHLMRQACSTNQSILVQHPGICSGDGACRDFKCGEGEICKEQGGRPTCVCPTCPETPELICGSNGISYLNECRLKAENCQNKKSITIKHKGLCESCESIKCDFYSVCEVDNDGQPKCFCPSTCVEVKQEVCGTDGVTYQNECFLRLASCNKQKSISTDSLGPCGGDSCDKIVCENGARCEKGRCICPTNCPNTPTQPLCATNGVTYPNECLLKKAACDQSMDLEIEYLGYCDDLSGSGELCDSTTCAFGGKCSLSDDSSTLFCNCDFGCTHIRSEICGSDGRTYGNDCLMKEEACRRQSDIYLQSMEACDDFITEEACDGRQPLLDPWSGAEIDCSAGAWTCPSNSYCQKLGHKSICCPQDGSCQCNNLGSLGTSKCDSTSGQCTCMPAVTGLKCDRCEVGYWGIQRIASVGNSGCTPCRCNSVGSLRQDCDQMTGRCECKPGFTGQKCHVCVNGQPIGPQGCRQDLPPPPERPTSSDSISSGGSGNNLGKTCDGIECKFDGWCEVGRDGYARCVCPNDCNKIKDTTLVCGSDGITYGSECQLHQFQCHLQQSVKVVKQGKCEHSGSATTEGTSGLGSECVFDEDCLIENSVCSFGSICVCEVGFKTSPDNMKCVGAATEAITLSPEPTPSIKGEATEAITLAPEPTPSIKGVGSECFFDDDCPVEHSVCSWDSECVCDKGFKASLDNMKCIDESQEVIIPDPTKSVEELGSECTFDDDCPIENSVCNFDSICVCDVGYKSSPDNMKCVASAQPTRPPFTVKPSDSNELGGVDYLADESLSVKQRSQFSGKSWLKLSRHHSGEEHIRLEISFLPNQPNGIILYSGQSKAVDFISISLKDGHVEFRYELGSGPALLKSGTPVEMGVWHNVIAERKKRDGILRVNSLVEASGTSLGSLTSLNLDLPFYMGGVPAEASEGILKNVGVDVGLQGCIRSLRVTGSGKLPKDYNLNFPNSLDVMDAKNLGPLCDGDESKPSEVSNPCDSNPCPSGSVCDFSFSTAANGYKCNCPPGFTGDLCQNKENTEQTASNNGADERIRVPKFNGETFVTINTKDDLRKELSFELWLMAEKSEGLIFYGRGKGEKNIDFMALSLSQGFPLLSFNLGSGAVSILSSETLQLNSWHKLRVTRSLRDVEITLDDVIVGSGSSKGSLTELNLEERLYLGGHPDLAAKDTPLQGISEGFHGAIQRFYLNGGLLEEVLEKAIKDAMVPEYLGPPCSQQSPTQSVCLNGGVCVPVLDDFECRCTASYVGKTCQNNIAQQKAQQKRTGVGFDGQRMQLFKIPLSVPTKYEVEFRTTARDGLIFYTVSNETNGGYLAVGLKKGHVEVRLGTFKQHHGAIMRSEARINDGLWHVLTIHRDKRGGYMLLDHHQVAKKRALSLDPEHKEANMVWMWLGGANSITESLPSSFRMNFQGCISRVAVDAFNLDLDTEVQGRSDLSARYCGR